MSPSSLKSFEIPQSYKIASPLYLMQQTPCGHKFVISFITRWLSTHTICPTCGEPLSAATLKTVNRLKLCRPPHKIETVAINSLKPKDAKTKLNEKTNDKRFALSSDSNATLLASQDCCINAPESEERDKKNVVSRKT